MDNLIINKKETLAWCNDNHTLANDLITMLKADLPRQKMILIQAYQTDDERTVRDIVHQILGTCSYISLPHTQKVATAFQTAINKKENLEPFKNQLIAAIDAVIVAL